MNQLTKVSINLDRPIGIINPNLYGHFAEHLGQCIYEGLWVGTESSIPNYNGFRKDVVDALKKLHIPVLRWPGGCFADDYHWQDGIGPREKRPVRINRWWDDKEPNLVGTHEFLYLCELLNCEPYICGNMGSGTVREMSDWLEYMNCSQETTWAKLRAVNGHPAPFKVHYFGVGNENWGCGGKMSPQYYANEYRRYTTFLSSYDKQKPLFRIACGANAFDYSWTDKFFSMMSGKLCECSNQIGEVDGYSIHYYCGTAGTSLKFTELEWHALLVKAFAMEELICEHRKIMDKYDPARRVALICDEWGTWHKVLDGTNPHWLKQQSTMRDAAVAGITLDIFNRNADKIQMGNIAQLINVLQSMINTEGPKMYCTPTYHVFNMYQAHQKAQAMEITVDTEELEPLMNPAVSGSCSVKNNILTLSLVSIDTKSSREVVINIPPGINAQPLTWQVLASSDFQDHNTIENPEKVQPITRKFDGDKLILPPASVNVIQYQLLEKK